jgi:hypothetical protein
MSIDAAIVDRDGGARAQRPRRPEWQALGPVCLRRIRRRRPVRPMTPKGALLRWGWRSRCWPSRCAVRVFGPGVTRGRLFQLCIRWCHRAAALDCPRQAVPGVGPVALTQHHQRVASEHCETRCDADELLGVVGVQRSLQQRTSVGNTLCRGGCDVGPAGLAQHADS